MKVTGVLVALCLVSVPVYAWERLVTKSGAHVEGDITQAEFLFEDPSGGEIIIPRAAVQRFESGADGMTAILKDGTSVTGQLVGKVEIEDGLIRRRYDGAEIDRVDFDNYIAVESGKSYHSCPIRLMLPAAGALFRDPAVGFTALTGAVTCNDLKIVNVAFSRTGNLRGGKAGSVTARFTVAVPEGADQLAELSLELVQSDLAVATARKRLTIDEGELSVIPLKLNVSAGKLLSEAEPVFRIQLVTQDATREIERGGFFWWFTLPIPL